MATIEVMDLGDGNSIRVEVEERESSGIGSVGRGPREVAASLKDALVQVRSAINMAIKHVRELPEPPSTVALEFGLTFVAQAGVVVARAGTMANFKVTLEWVPPARGDGE